MRKTLASCLILLAAAHLPTAIAAPGDISGRVSYVKDGDTFVIGDTTIRLHGVDAPEKTQTCWDSAKNVHDCGGTATEQLRGLVDGAVVNCVQAQKDLSYGRAVSTCTRDDGVDLGAWMVEHGFAVEETGYSHGKYAGQTRQARSAGAGLWSLKFLKPSEYR